MSCDEYGYLTALTLTPAINTGAVHHYWSRIKTASKVAAIAEGKAQIRILPVRVQFICWLLFSKVFGMVSWAQGWRGTKHEFLMMILIYLHLKMSAVLHYLRGNFLSDF